MKVSVGYELRGFARCGSVMRAEEVGGRRMKAAVRCRSRAPGHRRHFGAMGDGEATWDDEGHYELERRFTYVTGSALPESVPWFMADRRSRSDGPAE